MYNLNKLERNVLITANEVIFHAATKHTLDKRMIESSIIIAEERFIVPELGYDLYKLMVDSKNKILVSGDLATYQPLIGAEPVLVAGDVINAYEMMSTAHQALWKQYLWKLIAECVMVGAYPEGFIQFGSEGAFHNSPPAGLMVTSGFVSPLLGSMKWALDKKIQDRIAPLLMGMHNYICTNKTDFALYIKDCPECVDKTKQTKFSGIALGLYDDVDNVVDRCCPPGIF